MRAAIDVADTPRGSEPAVVETYLEAHGSKKASTLTLRPVSSTDAQTALQRPKGTPMFILNMWADGVPEDEWEARLKKQYPNHKGSKKSCQSRHRPQRIRCTDLALLLHTDRVRLLKDCAQNGVPREGNEARKLSSEGRRVLLGQPRFRSDMTHIHLF